MPMKHWTRFLPDSMPLVKESEAQEINLMRIQTKQGELNRLMAEYESEEEKIARMVLKEWTQQEINEAKITSVLTAHGA